MPRLSNGRSHGKDYTFAPRITHGGLPGELRRQHETVSGSPPHQVR